jgi:ParB-like chromosome segregation protein Spo0J
MRTQAERDVALGDIAVPPDRLRQLRPEIVTSLAESMRVQGLLQPIVLQPGGVAGFTLVAGRHRLEAARQLGWRAIPAGIVAKGTSLDPAVLAEIDENLIRADLSPAERAGHVAARKQVYERLHPDTVAGIAGGKARHGSANDKLSFAESTAQATGKNRQTVERDARRGQLGAVILAKVTNTSLDQGDELDALLKLPPERRNPLIARAGARERVSAKVEAKKARREFREQELAGKQIALPDKKYGVVYEDFEWDFVVRSEAGKAKHASNHYPTRDCGPRCGKSSTRWKVDAKRSRHELDRSRNDRPSTPPPEELPRAEIPDAIPAHPGRKNRRRRPAEGLPRPSSDEHGKPRHLASSSAGAAMTQPAGIQVTWARTPGRLPINKRQVTTGKWPVSAGVKATKIAVEHTHYPDLAGFTQDYLARRQAGCWALVAGVLAPGLDPGKPWPRTRKHFVDTPRALLILDCDGLAPAPGGQPLDGATAWNSSAPSLVLTLLPKAFGQAGYVTLATASTGLAIDSAGQPAAGRARFRLVFHLARPLTLREQKILVERLRRLPGLGCLDIAVYSPEHWLFIAPPSLLNDSPDPIGIAAVLAPGRVLAVDDVLAELKVDLGTPDTRTRPTATVTHERRLQAPADQCEKLLSGLVKALPNDCAEKGDRPKWIGVGHAIKGACGGEPWGLEIYLEWCSRWPCDDDNPQADVDAWNSLEDGINGIDYLLGWAHKVGTPEALAAVRATELASFGVIDDGAAKDDRGDHEDEDRFDDNILARQLPEIDRAAFYGLEKIVDAATEHSEATKIGVAMQILAHVSLTLRPFYFLLGDKKMPLNLFVVQVGPTAKGRKGTSAAIADDHLGPIILTEAARAQMADPGSAARQAREQAVQDYRQADEKLARLAGLNEASLFGLIEQIIEIEGELATIPAEMAALRQKLASKAKVWAPSTARLYERRVAELAEREKDKRADLAQREEDLTTSRNQLANKSALMTAAEAERDAAAAGLRQLEDELDELPDTPTAEPWRRLYGELANPPALMRGVSSGEGVIQAIRDPGQIIGQRGLVDDPGKTEKRLFINLSEFGSMLAPLRRENSILSTVVRGGFDCETLETGAKNNPVRVKQPFIAISASVTPREIRGLMIDARDQAGVAENGFANRFLYLYAKRTQLVPEPLPTPGLDDLMREIARNICKVYAALKPTGEFMATPIVFSAEAKAFYGQEYKRIDTLADGASLPAANLLGRLTTHLLRLSAVIAVTAGEAEISIGAVKAAIAWVEYAAATVNAIAATAKERARLSELRRDSEAIMKGLVVLGGANQWVPSRDVRRRTDLEEKRFYAAVGWLQTQAPSPISIQEGDWTLATGGTRKRSLLRLNVAPKSGSEASA